MEKTQPFLWAFNGEEQADDVLNPTGEAECCATSDRIKTIFRFLLA